MARFNFKPVSAPPGILESNWNSWTWQLQQSLKTEADFQKYFQLSSSEKEAFAQGHEVFNIRATPYYAQLAGAFPEDPIRQILMPQKFELYSGTQQMLDPLAERKNSPVPRVIHRYSDRALFLITDICSVYCRFCTRKHFTGQEQAFLKNQELEAALQYFRSTPGLREVILSGGDPLTVSTGQLERILESLRQIEHIEVIRIGTRMPVVAPQRIDEDLCRLLRKMKPVFMMTHFNHPREITAQSATALEMLVDHGVPVLNQMVLLNGINNHPAIVQALSRRLLYLRVKPYYMFQCDPSVGTDHLRTSVENSMDIQKELWGHFSGLGLPQLSLDIPNGGGKTSLVPDFQISQNKHIRKFQGWDGVEAEYISPASEQMRIPIDTEVYLEEWNTLKNSRTSMKHSVP